MAGVKPTTASGYSADVTEACERTRLTLIGAFGSLGHTLRLVGGLVPRYLTPETPPDVPAHAGTADVDIRSREHRQRICRQTTRIRFGAGITEGKGDHHD
ncbi:hypothetical protein [Burkholderia ambifaria]|uniref:hypothetical protein n=1 Tax=Burkholderia ambifaria TaxID=152480 RepID=UPI0033913F52